MKADRVWLLLFVVLTCAELGAELAGSAELAFVTKATLLPLLGLWFTTRLSGRLVPPFRSMTTVFLASWVGDISLMLAPASAADLSILGIPKHPAWFLVGVCAFSLMHVRLIAIYRHVDRPAVPGPWTTDRRLFLPLGLAAAGVFAAVIPPLAADPERGLAAVPVALYGALLVTMVGFAIQRLGRVSARSFALTTAGAATFLVSDSLIGLTMLVPGGGFPLASFWIMVTYLLAEILIARGIMEQIESPAA